MILLITYDLHGRRDYEPVIDLLEKVDHVHPLESVWIVDTQTSCRSWLETLREVGDSDDEFFVVELYRHWWASHLDKSAVTWLKDPKRTWRSDS